MKVIVLNNGALSFVELEMKADGVITFGTDFDNPNFAEVARAVGLYGTRVERPDELDDALKAAFAHPGPAVVDVLTVRHEIAVPPTVTVQQAKEFTLWVTRSILKGSGKRSLRGRQNHLRQIAAE